MQAEGGPVGLLWAAADACYQYNMDPEEEIRERRRKKILERANKEAAGVKQPTAEQLSDLPPLIKQPKPTSSTSQNSSSPYEQPASQPNSPSVFQRYASAKQQQKHRSNCLLASKVIGVIGGLLSSTFQFQLIIWGLILCCLVLISIHNRQAKVPTATKPFTDAQKMRMLEAAQTTMKLVQSLKLVVNVFGGFCLVLLMRLERDHRAGTIAKQKVVQVNVHMNQEVLAERPIMASYQDLPDLDAHIGGGSNQN